MTDKSSSPSPNATEIFEKVTSTQKAECAGGLAALQRFLKSKSGKILSSEDVEFLEQLESSLLDFLLDQQEVKNSDYYSNSAEHQQQSLHGAFASCFTIITAIVDLKIVSEADTQPILSSEKHQKFLNELVKFGFQCVFSGDYDLKLQWISVDVFGAICKLQGPSFYQDHCERLKDFIKAELVTLASVSEDISANASPDESNQPPYPVQPSASNVDGSSSLHAPLSSMEPLTALYSKSIKLELTLRFFQVAVANLKQDFLPFVDSNLMELIFGTLSHPSRFVREAGFSFCAALAEIGPLDFDTYGRFLAQKMSEGLSDHCSQVRMSAGIACRKLLQGVSENVDDDPNWVQVKKEYHSILLPSLCLSRYYVADTKFMLYSQESWRILAGNDGALLVSQFMDKIVEHYKASCSSENRAVREAACACIAELSRKIDREVVLPHVTSLLQTLESCFKDQSWQVRDATCLATGNFMVNYPEESKVNLNRFLSLFRENLSHPISLVRQGAAAAISQALKAYGRDILSQIIQMINEGLQNVQNQTSLNCQLEISSLEHIVYRPPEPWETCDGCMYLIGDIAEHSFCQSELPPLVPKIVEAVGVRNYPQHVTLLETMCKITPLLAKGIGKKPFKEHLSSVFEPIFYSLQSGNYLANAAAKFCLRELSALYGPNILRSRVELFNPRFLQLMETCDQ